VIHVNIGGNDYTALYMNCLHALVAIWQDASQRSLNDIWLSRSAQV